MQQLSESFYFAYVSMLLQGKQQLISVGLEFDLTLVQCLTLLMLDNVDEPSMSSFCRLYECDASNITGIVDGLEQKELVSRQAHPTDRRIKVIHLEPAGKALQSKLVQRLAETSSALFSKLDPTEMRQFVDLVHKLGHRKSLAAEVESEKRPTAVNA